MTQNSNTILDKRDLKKVFLLNFSNEGAWDHARGNNLGYAIALIPALKKIYADDPEKYKDALYRHTNEFFNTAMQPIPFIQGMILSMEEENAKSDSYDVSMITGIKTALIGPAAGIFDAIFLNTIRIIGTAVGTSFALQGNPVGVLLFLLIFNIPNFYCKYKGAFLGYELGAKFIDSALNSGLMEKFKYATSVIAMMVFGSMTCEWVYLNVTLSVGVGEAEQTLQSIIDSVAPNILNMGLLWLCWWLIFKKKVNNVVLMLLMFCVALICAYYGILGE